MTTIQPSTLKSQALWGLVQGLWEGSRVGCGWQQWKDRHGAVAVSNARVD